MKYTFTRKQIVNAFNNKILDDDNFLTYLLSTTSKDRPINQKLLDKGKGIKSKCCNAEVIISGGGYDGEDIVPISETCSKCGELCKVKYPVGRPIKLSL